MTDIRVNKQTDLTIAFQYYESNGTTKRTLTGATVFLTVKTKQSDNDASDTDAPLTKTVSSHIDATTGLTNITLTNVETNLAPGAYYYDIKVKESDNKLYVAQSGRFIVTANPTNRSS